MLRLDDERQREEAHASQLGEQQRLIADMQRQLQEKEEQLKSLTAGLTASASEWPLQCCSITQVMPVACTVAALVTGKHCVGWRASIMETALNVVWQ